MPVLFRSVGYPLGMVPPVYVVPPDSFWRRLPYFIARGLQTLTAVELRLGAAFGLPLTTG